MHTVSCSFFADISFVFDGQQPFAEARGENACPSGCVSDAWKAHLCVGSIVRFALPASLCRRRADAFSSSHFLFFVWLA